MDQRPNTPNDESDLLSHYRSEFGAADRGDMAASAYPKDTRVAKAYEIALDIRKFEIDLFWKRAGYFWLLLAALVTALGLVLTAGNVDVLPLNRREHIALFLSCAGAVLAFAWSLANGASKSWQRNWEFQVDVLEDIVVGPLYKTVLFRDRPKPSVYFSLSDVSIWISIYFCALFVACSLYFSGIGRAHDVDWVKVFILGANIAFVALLLVRTRRVREAKGLQYSLAYLRRSVTIAKKFDPSIRGHERIDA